MKWTFEIPEWTPMSLNKVRGRHWSAESRAKKGTADLLVVYARMAGVPLVTDTYRPKRKLSLTVMKKRKSDEDNYLKIFLDSLKRARLIVDDGSDWLIWEKPVLLYPFEPRTIIELEDIE